MDQHDIPEAATVDEIAEAIWKAIHNPHQFRREGMWRFTPDMVIAALKDVIATIEQDHYAREHLDPRRMKGSDTPS